MYDLARQPAAEEAPRHVCPSCGLLTGSGPNCAGCQQSVVPLSVPPSESCWAVLYCNFTCGACGFATPLTRIEVDGSVQCSHCGLVQVFEVHQWDDALSIAHDVADVAGPNAPHRATDPSYAALDIAPLSQLRPGDWVNQSLGALAVQASPGHPTCQNCGALRSVHAAGPGHIMMVCPQCDERVTYALPTPNPYPSLVAVAAEEARQDRQRAEVRGEGVAIELACPSCHAPLPATEDSRVVTCSYCKATAYIPLRTWSVVQPKEIAREPIWVCFMGPSSLRLKAEKKASKWRAAEQSAQTRQAQAQVLACPGCGATRASATESCGACRYGLPWYRRHMIALIVGGAILFVVVMVVLPIVVGALVSFASIVAG